MIPDLQRIFLSRKPSNCFQRISSSGGAILSRPPDRAAGYLSLLTSSPCCSCVRLSEGSEGGIGRNANHMCSPEPSTGLIGEVVWSLFPYLNLTENCCCFDLPNENLTLWIINFTFLGSSAASRPSAVGVSWGREGNPEEGVADLGG